MKVRKRRREKKRTPEQVPVGEQAAGEPLPSSEAREAFLRHAAEVTRGAAVFEPEVRVASDEDPAGTHGLTAAVFATGARERGRIRQDAEELARRLQEFYSA